MGSVVDWSSASTSRVSPSMPRTTTGTSRSSAVEKTETAAVQSQLDSWNIGWGNKRHFLSKSPF